MADPTPYYQLTYLPYLAMKDEPSEIRFGRVTIWNADAHLYERVPDEALRARVTQLLDMNTQTANVRRRSSRVPGIGILTIGEDPLHELSPEESADVEDARIALFLSGLDYSTSIKPGGNAGHFVYTSENFGVVYQRFRLDNDYVAERAGIIIQFTHGGLPIADTIHPKPVYVSTPMRPGLDRALLYELNWLREADPVLFRRVIRAGTEFLGSYHNSPSVDIDSRIFAQAMAFEILFELPERDQRKAFKNRIESLCNDENEPLVSWESERGAQKTETETRSIKVMWADQFYMLRNHLIHGLEVPADEFLFRDKQHHIFAAAILFILALKRTLNEARIAADDKPRFYDTVSWKTWTDHHDHPPSTHEGFVSDVADFAQAAAKAGMTPEEYMDKLLSNEGDAKSA